MQPIFHRLLGLHSMVLLCLFLLAGCATKRDVYNVPVVPLPERFEKIPTVMDAADAKNDVVVAPQPALALNEVLEEWWHLLGSRELDDLMDRVLVNNPDLRIAALRIAQTKARLDQAGADKLPVISAPVQVNTTAPEFGVGSVAPGGKITSRTTYQASLQGNWRPDIWGERAALYESAELQLWRATFQRDDTQRTVVANVVSTYTEFLSLNDRLKVANETAKALSEMLASVDARLEAGDATVTEMEQQKTAVYSVKATIPVLEQQREVVLNRLASLAGTLPGKLSLGDFGLDSVRFPGVLPGVPSALLLRRPDVRVVEARLLAADADIDVARARVLPPLDLSAQVGYGSLFMAQLFSPQSLLWNAVANLSATIFDSDKRSLEVDFAKAVHEEMVETYIRVIKDAVREVDDALSAIRFTGNRLEAQQTAKDSALRAWNFSQESYMAGAVDHLVVLDTERTYHRNLDDWYNVRMERYRGLISLFSALGGGASKGGALPGKGVRPAALTAEVDYGAILSATVPSAVAGIETPQANAADVAGAGQKPEVPALNPPSKSSTNSSLNQVPVLPKPEKLDAPVGVTFMATPPGRVKVEGVDWSENRLRENGGQWQVEMSGVYDRAAVTAAWRDLRARFPEQTKGLSLLPQNQGQVDDAGKERASWYRLFIAKLPDQQIADALCATLRAGQQRCRVVPSQMPAEPLEKEGVSAIPPRDVSGTVAAGSVVLEKDGFSANPPLPGKAGNVVNEGNKAR